MKLFLITILLSCISFAGTLRPRNVEDLHQSSVRIMNLAQTSGGTGSIFRSYRDASHILTNKHVCRLIEQGGYVVKDERRYLITHYKKFEHHDLCLVRVKNNLGISLVISETLAKQSSTTYVSGHPNLLPHIATRGHLSGRMEIELITGVRPCTEDDIEKDPLVCLFFGGMPLVEKFDSQVVSNLIKPGSSGSAVFNSDGEIVGVVYAGNGGDFSHGFIVPQIYLHYFLQNAHRQSWIRVGTPVDEKDIKDRTFSFEKCHVVSVLKPEIKNICKNIKDGMIWRQK